MRRAICVIGVALAALTAGCSRPSAALTAGSPPSAPATAILANTAATPASMEPSATAAPGSAFVTLTPVPVAEDPSTDDLPAQPSPVWIAPLPLSAGPEAPTTPGMRLAYSLDSAGFKPSSELWVVTSVERDGRGTHVVLQEQVGRTPGLSHVTEILPNDALEGQSYDIGFKSGARLTLSSGVIEFPAPAVSTPAAGTFTATYTEASQSTQLAVSTKVQRLGTQRIVVPAGTYDANVIQEEISYVADGIHAQIGYLLDLVPRIGIVKETEQWSTDGGQPRDVGTLALTSVTGGPAA